MLRWNSMCHGFIRANTGQDPQEEGYVRLDTFASPLDSFHATMHSVTCGQKSFSIGNAHLDNSMTIHECPVSFHDSCAFYSPTLYEVIRNTILHWLLSLFSPHDPSLTGRVTEEQSVCTNSSRLRKID